MSSLEDILKTASKFAGIDLTRFLNNQSSNEEQISSTYRLEEPVRSQQFSKRVKKEQKKIDRKEVAKRRAIANKKSNIRKLEKLEKQLKKSGIDNPDPINIPAHIWKQSQFIIADSSGWAARFYSRLCWHKVGVGLIHKAALPKSIENENVTYAGVSPRALRSRSILSLGLGLIGCSKQTGRKNQGWNRLVSGIPQTAFIAMLADPHTGKRIHRNTLTGIHRKNKNYSNGDIGYLQALKKVGFCYCRQAHWKFGQDPREIKGFSDLKPSEMAGELHPSGWFTSTVRYWIASDQYTDSKDAERSATLWLAWLAGHIPWQRDVKGHFVPISTVPYKDRITPIEKPPDRVDKTHI